MIFHRTRTARNTVASLVVHDLDREVAFPAVGFVASVPGTEAPLVPLELPATLTGQARDRVARRQLRDAYGGSDSGIDARPASLGDAADRWRAMLVVDRQARRDWAHKVASAGPLCQAILPDYLTLPASRDLWVIDVFGQVIRARLGLDDGFTAEPDLALALLQGALTKVPPRAVLRHGPLSPDLDAWLAAQSLAVCLDPAGLSVHGVTPPERFAHGELSLDLGRDPDAERAAMRRTLRGLSLPIAMGLTGCLGWVTAALLEVTELRTQALTYRQNSERILREVVIPTGPILDIRAQVSQVIDRARSASTETETEARPLDVLRRAGEVLQAHETTITRISYQPGAGLVIDLQIADFAALDALVAALRTVGTEPHLAQSVTRDGGGVEAVLAMAVRQKGRNQ